MRKAISDEVFDEAVVELQVFELDRLLTAKWRVYEETDRLLKIVMREYVLHQQIQNQLKGLQEPLALPESRRLESRLNETEGNLSLLKQVVWKLVLFREGKRKSPHQIHHPRHHGSRSKGVGCDAVGNRTAAGRVSGSGIGRTN